ncbi:MAG TPA: YdcF family protein [Terriglobales bacterium]|nr:YdcF family protein [Terriglobales bacterium]
MPENSSIRSPEKKRRRFFWRFLVLLLVAFLIYCGLLFRRIARQSGMDEARAADVIVVLGAAEYGGRPSPVYRARLEHAAELYEKGLAAFVITSGGPGGELHFSEGQVGRDYLKEHGIPESQLIAETQSHDTNESSQRVAAIMRANGMKTCIAVSDGYHMYRVKEMLQSQGVEVYGSPRAETKPLSFVQHSRVIMEEVSKYIAWKLHLS